MVKKAKKAKRIKSKIPFVGILIPVCDKDIKGAERRDTEKCPVARAVRRVTGLPARVCPHSKNDVFYEKTGNWCDDYINHRITVKAPNSVLIFKMPDDVVKKVKTFDDSGKMEPFAFKLTL